MRSVWCVVCAWCVLCVAKLDTRKNSRVKVQNVSVCMFKTLPCIPAKRPHVEHMRAFCRHTRWRFEPTHEVPLSPLLLSFSRPFFFLSSFVLFLCSPLFSLLSALFSPHPVTMSMITRSVGSLCTQSSDLPECQCAWASVHSLFSEHVRIMQETDVLL